MAQVAAVNDERTQFSREVAADNLKPLWERVTSLQPGTPCVPAIWRYERLRPYLLRATELIAPREAERRVLMLENPGLPGTTFITNTLFTGMQIILPGEIAPSHRHSPNAFRLVIEGEGAYTAVEGERVTMRPGDFVMTPGWTWHDHGHLGTGPVIWMDGLDTAFAKFFGALFREDYSEEKQPLSRAEGDAAARYGANLLPVDYRPGRHASPLLCYPYERTRQSLARLARNAPPHPAHGIKLRFANPADGGHAFRTMATFMQWLPAGFAGCVYRSTDGTVFNAVEGRGSVEIGDQRFAFAPHDVFVVPPWQAYQLRAESDCVLFSYSDRAAQEALGFWKERFD